MLLTGTQFNAVMRIFEDRRNADRRAAEERRRDIYNKHPRLNDIDDEIRSLSIRRAELLLYKKETGEEEKERLRTLKTEKDEILRGEGVIDEDFTPSYYCPDCKDTGYVKGKKCHCLKQAEIDLVYQQSHLKKMLEVENFSNFRLDLYSDEPAEKGESSPRKLAAAAEKTCREFVETFDTDFRNLLFLGDTGVGKTFLSNCIAKELLDSGHSVIYFTANRLFDILEKDVFKKNRLQEEGYADEYSPGENRKNIYEAELLVIDDLGTELINTFTVSQLTACLNERMMRERSTIISTNLNVRELTQNYSMRVFSRLNLKYTFIPLIGEDIRFKKMIRDNS